MEERCWPCETWLSSDTGLLEGRQLGEEPPGIGKTAIVPLIYPTPKERLAVQIDDQNGVDPFSSQRFGGIVGIDIRYVGTMHEFVGIVRHRQRASARNQFIQLAQPGVAQILQGADRGLSVQAADRHILGSGSRKRHRKARNDQDAVRA